MSEWLRVAGAAWGPPARGKSTRAARTTGRLASGVGLRADGYLPLKLPWQLLQSAALRRAAASPLPPTKPLAASTSAVVRSFHAFSSPFGGLLPCRAVNSSTSFSASALVALPSATFSV